LAKYLPQIAEGDIEEQYIVATDWLQRVFLCLILILLVMAWCIGFDELLGQIGLKMLLLLLNLTRNVSLD
jgi:hypothetical protein